MSYLPLTLWPEYSTDGLMCVSVCVCVYDQVSSLEWINLLLTNRRYISVDTHIPCLCEVVLGALPALISPLKNDVFRFSNKRIFGVATPVQQIAIWSKVGSLEILCLSDWQREEFCLLPTSQRTRTWDIYDSTEQSRVSRCGKIMCRNSFLRRPFPSQHHPQFKFSVCSPDVGLFNGSLAWTLNEGLHLPSQVLIIKKSQKTYTS